MVDESVEAAVRNYLNRLKDAGFDDCFAVVYGSQVTDKKNLWSDIDILVVSSLFDHGIKRSDVNLLWRLAASTDSRIEPVPAGKKQYETDNSNVIIEIARRNGIIILSAA
jgi:predicted nucleotidyltransferase